jgi:hypothetical protein
MTKRQWLNRKVVGVGEAMVEFAPVGENIYRRGFAGGHPEHLLAHRANHPGPRRSGLLH